MTPLGMSGWYVRSVVAVVVLCACGGLTPESLWAQDANRTPVFVLQPGLLITDFVSSAATASSTGFNARFSTLLPTRRKWLTPTFGVNVTPYGTAGFTTSQTNAPSVFAGNMFPLVPDSALGGWLRADVPVLLYYTYHGGGPHNTRLFGKDIYVELAFTSSLGQKLLGGLGPNWKRLEAYLLLDQNLTPNPNLISGRTDRFNPIALFGIAFRFGKQP